MFIRWHHTWGAAGGLGTPAPLAGCIVPALEAILGFHLQGTQLMLSPCIPKQWPRFELVFRHRSTRYEIAVENPQGVNRGVVAATLDGLALPAGEPRIQLLDDGITHRIELILG